MTPTANAPIGIFDSGLGGLTVAAAIAARLPQERILYLGDTARVPYGNRSAATVVRYARNNVAFLHERGVKMIVVACNTVSAQGLGGLADGALLPIMGVIRPGARAALEVARGEIAVLGTPATARSGAYELAIHEIDPTRTVRTYACPLFVPLVEAGWLNHPITYKVAEEYLSPLIETRVDTLILGCTHYPLLRGVIDEVSSRLLGRRLTIIDSACSVAAAVERFLDESRLRATATPRRRFFVTDAPEGVQEIAARFWGDSLGEPLRLEHVDLVDKG